MSRKEFVAETAQKMLLKVATTRGELNCYGKVNPSETTVKYMSVSPKNIAEAVRIASGLANELEQANEAPWQV